MRYSWGSLTEIKIDLFALYAHLNFSTIKYSRKILHRARRGGNQCQI
nr:MAG TPA: hypothetical protein [Caudoviricetes sp.]